ncbi:unnamed protein product, partial [Cylicostephanus goldi]
MLITFTEKPNAPLYEGLFYVAGLFFSGILRTLLMNNYFTVMYRIGTKIQTSLTTAVYNKTMKLSNASRREKTHGEIVNLMAIDVDRFRMITPQLQQYWSSPLQRSFSISLIPFNICISLFAKKWMVQQMRLKDERIRMTNEILSGI